MFRVELFRNSDIGETSENYKFVELNDTQCAIVKLLLDNNHMSAANLSEKIGIARRNVENNIKKLKEYGLLVRHGSPKNGYWEVMRIGEDIVKYNSKKKLTLT